MSVQFAPATDEPVPNLPNCKITLTKNTRGYGWEVTARNDDMEQCAQTIKTADDWLRENYGTTE